MALFFSTFSRAQVSPPTPPPPLLPYPPGLHLFPIVVQGHPPDLKVTLATEENGKPFLYCEGRCEAWAYPGEYWVSVRSTRDTAAGTKEIRLNRPSTIEVRPRERDAQANTTALGLGFLGGGLALFGASLYMAEHGKPDAEGGHRDAAAIFTLSVLSGVAGLVLLIVGGARDTTVPTVTITD